MTRLKAKPEGGLRVLDPPEDVPPDQLVKLRAYRDELAPIVAAYGEVDVLIRPTTPMPEPITWPGKVWFKPRTWPRRSKS